MVLNKPSLSSLATKQLKKRKSNDCPYFFTKLCSFIIHLLMLLSMVSVCRGAANSYTMSNFISTTSTMADTGDGGKATSARMFRPNGCWMTTDGIMYVADANKNRIRRVDTSNIINSYAGSSSSATSTGDGGPASSATFNSAFHVWGNSLGVLYVSEQSGYKIRAIDLTSTVVATFVGNGTVGSFGNGGPATAAIIGEVWGVFGDTMANLYVADSVYNRIRRVDYLTRIISLICGTGTSSYNGDNLPSTSTNVHFPSNVFITTTAVLYFSETYGHRVRFLSSTTGLVSAFAGTGAGSTGSSGGAATSSAINEPQGVAIDSEGSVYFPTVQGHRLHQVTTNNIFYHVAGSGSIGVGTGTALNAAIGYPKAAWITSTGTIYCPADGTVRMLTNINPTTIPTAAPTVAPSVSQSPTTALPTLNPTFTFTPGPFFMTLEGGTGTGGSGADGIPATSSALRQPYQVCHSSVTAIQGLLVADYYNLLVKKIDDNGIVTRFAGGGTSTSAGLPATSFYLYNPVSVMADTSGNVLIGSDQGNYIHKVSSSGSIVSRYAGTGMSITSPTDLNGDNGPATSASLCLPYFIHTDTVSQTYFADFCALRVRKITTSGIISSIAGTGAYDTSLTTGPATSSALYYPYGVYCDTNGKVYISEYNGQRLKVVASGIHYWIAGTGNAGFNLESGSATSVQFSHPTGVFGDSSGNIFLSDASARVRVLLTDGILSTIMGTGVTAASLIYSGMATSVPIKPHGIYVDSAGFIHVSDVYDGTGGNLIRKVYSVAPTAAPSVSFSPSVTPTIAPSALPSIVPTICPSVLPTVSPTDGPSIVPSNAPTAVPTLKPTIAPTVAPTVPPTVTPTVFPTVMPTVEPSLMPTVAPTTVPTMLPTVLPTLDPTVTPTLAPTCRPTALPSVHPSMLPSDSPTVSPSCSPSLAPSDSPSVVPSELPTASPSEFPSIFPSEMPSRTPTEQPTVSPSVSPSKKPSTAPTFGPTVTPTVEPSVGPTLCPSIVPSLAPSIFPTELPSTIPTHIPSVLPSQGPSVLPSIGPSFPPTNEPSLCPSVLPTVVPSKTPSEPPSQGPTLAPSLDPSARPSTLPTLVPTSLPTVKPSVDPSLLPTAVPTTIRPTIAPSTLEFYLTHPRATLPSNRSISVVGYYSGVKFKIVLPFLSVSKVTTADAFSDVTLITGATGEAKLVSGGELLASTIDVRTQPLSYVKSIAFDNSQRSVSVIPDFNGDGYDDLIIGNPFASRCYVLFGNEQGLTNMTTGFTIFGQDVDLTGWSVSGAGDFNNDTMQDIVIGAPNAEGVGAVYVIYGKHMMMDVYLNNLTSSVGFSFFGAISNDFVGISVSNAGDVNKDGCDDIVIGSVGTAAYFAGAAFIIYGGRALQPLASSALLTTNQGYKLSGVSYQYAGYSVSAAEDVNKDGYDDVVIGSCPQRSGLTLSSYVIFGAPSASVTSNVQLTSLTASQGVRITGAGVIVSGAGDVNNDTFSDVLVTSLDVTGDQKMGWIVYSNIDRLLVQTSVYTANPTRLPSHAPSRWPSVRPTLRPSRAPTVQPVIVPSVAPTGPTFQPNSLTGAPTKLPTDLPTVVPSMEPSESPTAVPSVEPSEKPSCEPSRLPTAHPSVQPSEVPSVIPTVQTSSTHPSLGAATRPPFSVPTFLPTVADTFPDIVDFQVRGGSDVLDHSDSLVNYRYVVNATGQVGIVSSRGANTYYIVPQTNLTLTIWTFNQSTDVIDLTLYKSFYRMSDLSISSGSINIRLSTTELIHILNLEPKDITNSNFVFAAEEPDNQFMHFVVTVISVSVSLGGLLIILFFAYRFYQWRAKKALDLAGVWATRLMMTYASTADGEYLFKADIPQKDVDSALPDWINESDGSKNDDLLSQHTLDSEGDWMFKSLKANNCTSVHNPEVDSVDSRLMSEFSFNSDGDFVDKV